MKTLIIEDERAAVRNLLSLLDEVAPECEVIGTLCSICDAVEWFATHNAPDLIFMDIHLADGHSFDIFEQVEITAPVIFTTAYDEYALKAFKVNSIDYLLKPIAAEDIRQALDKLSLRTTHHSHSPSEELRLLLRGLQKQEHYRKYFLVPTKGDKLIPLSTDYILYFHIEEGSVRAVSTDKVSFILPQTLDEVGESIDPQCFFRVNRQYILSRKAVKDLDLWFNGRLAVNLIVPIQERILVSKTRVAEFKQWFVG